MTCINARARIGVRNVNSGLKTGERAVDVSAASPNGSLARSAMHDRNEGRNVIAHRETRTVRGSHAEVRRRVAVRVLSVVFLGSVMSCERPNFQRQETASDSLAVLRAVPNIRGRAVCLADSIASTGLGMLVAECDFGDGVTRTVHGDTIFAVRRESVPIVSDSEMTLLDYWNRHLRREWEAKMGRVADDLNSSRSDHADRFEAIWNDSTGVRHMVTLARAEGGTVGLEYLSIDCREKDRRKQAIACW